jgi:membrane fusion protein (multidrug efflux system)
MKIHYRVPLILAVFLGSTISFTSCEDKAPPPPPPQELKVVEVIQDSVPVIREFVGEIKGIFDIPVRARVEGWVEKMTFEEGGEVKKDQLLYEIDDEQYQQEVAGALSQVAEAKTQLSKAESDLKRYKPLAEINAVSQSDLDAAQAAYDASIAGLEAANAHLRHAQISLGYCRMYAPIDGIIGKTEARVGEFVGKNPNPVILNTISRIDSVRVEFFLTESDYLTLARYTIQKLDSVAAQSTEEKSKKNTLQLVLSDGTVHPQKGFLDFVDRGVNPQTGSLLLQAIFPNTQGILRPGQFGRIQANIQTLYDAKIIPQKCLLELQGQFSVYVVTDSNTVAARSVVVGPTFKDYRVINEGLKPGDKVLLEGLLKVRSGMPIVPILTEYESQYGSID